MRDLKAVGDYFTIIGGFKVPILSLRIYGRPHVDLVTSVELYEPRRREPFLVKRFPVSREYKRMVDKYRQRVIRMRDKIAVRETLGGRCIRCGYNNIPDILEIDHIRENGAEMRRKGGPSNQQLMRWIINNPDEAHLDYQLLCPNCNRLKHNEYIKLQFFKYIF